MRISDILGLSLTNLWKRKMRTVLTILGVVIGTASIVVMLSLGFGLKQAMLDQVGTAGGLTEIMVYSDAMYGSDDLLLDDNTIALFEELDYVEKVDPQIIYYMPIKLGNYETYVELVGVTKDYMQKIELEKGEYPTPGSMLGIVVGNQIPMDLMDIRTGEWPDYESGEAPDVDFMSAPIIAGVTVEETYEPESDDSTDNSSDFYDDTFSVDSEFDFESEDDFESEEDSFENDEYNEDEYYEDEYSMDDYSYFYEGTKRVQMQVSGMTAGDLDTYTEFSYYCYTDIDMLKDFLRKNYGINDIIPGQPTDKDGKPYRDMKYSQLIVKVDEADNVEMVLEEIQSMGYQAEANKEWLEEIEKEFMIIEAVLGGIGAVAMLVAAISIANTMTMSIYERTKEIGVMKVLGCGLGNIRSMFLSEAAFIGFIGGVVGLGLSYLLSFVLNRFVAPYFMMDYFGMEMNISVISPWLALVAIGFSTIVGMVAGFFPAQRATRLSPLAAIRNE